MSGGEVSLWGLVCSSCSRCESLAGMGWGEGELCSGVSLHLQPLPWSHNNKRRWPETEICSEFRKTLRISWDMDDGEIFHSLLEKCVPRTIARVSAAEQGFRGDPQLLASFSPSTSKGPSDLSLLQSAAEVHGTTQHGQRMGCLSLAMISKEAFVLKNGTLKSYICLCVKALLEMPKST